MHLKRLWIKTNITTMGTNILTHLKTGDTAPEFTTKNEHGEPVSLKQFRGKKVVLYFYPKDDTPGCTKESCNLRDNYHYFLAKGYEVLGISADDEKSHRKFIAKYKLPFHLLSDPDHVVCEAYGVWQEKTLFLRNYMGIVRTTFVISEEGVIEKVITDVDTKNHSNQLL